MSTFAEKLEALKAKSAKIRQKRLEGIKDLAERTARVTFDASVAVSTAAKDAGKRMSLSAKEAGSRLSVTGSRLSVSAREARSRIASTTIRRFSVSSRRSTRLEDSKYYGDPLENSMSTQDGISGNRDFKYEDEAFEDDNVRNASDTEEKSEERDHAEEKSDAKPVTEPLPAESAIPAKLSTIDEQKTPKLKRPGVETKNWDPKSATHRRLHEALLNARWEEAVWCINKGADHRKWRGVLGETTLHEACMRRAPSPVIKALVRVGADVNAPTAVGLAPLHCACMYSPSATVIEVLIKAGARINQQSKTGMTPLAAASMQGRAIEVIALLLKNGANPRIIGTNGKTAKDYAKNERVQAFLEGVPAMYVLLACKSQLLPKEVLIRVRSFMY